MLNAVGVRGLRGEFEVTRLAPVHPVVSVTALPLVTTEISPCPVPPPTEGTVNTDGVNAELLTENSFIVIC